jgi:hypothetical protein
MMYGIECAIADLLVVSGSVGRGSFLPARCSVLALRVPSVSRIEHSRITIHLSSITDRSFTLFPANMAAAAESTAGAQADLLRRKPPRVSDLPLSSSKRASIDSLLHTFKKKGQFDELRKNTFAQFDHGVCS